MYVIGALGVTAGAHRLWSHRSYKAKLPVRIFLAICNSTAVQVRLFLMFGEINDLFFFEIHFGQLLYISYDTYVNNVNNSEIKQLGR